MNEQMTQDLRKLLGPNKACYVVITCDEPTPEGKMDVEMTYEGDPTLAAYLLDSARSHLESQFEDDVDVVPDIQLAD